MQVEKYKRRTRHNISDSTLKSRISAFENYKNHGFSGEPTVDKIEEWMDSLIEEYEDGRISTGTIRQYHNAMKSYFKQVKGEPDALDHISAWIPRGKTDHGDYLLEQEWEDMINSIYSYRDRCIVMLMYEYARRPGEIILLNVDDIDFDEETIRFTILKKREGPDGEKFRATFNLKDNCKRELEEYINHSHIEVKEENEDGEEIEPLFTTPRGRISYSSVWRMVKKHANKITPEKNITPKSMRHSRATHLDWSGFSPGEIARHQLIHEPDTDVISSYIHDRSEDQVRDVMEIDEDED